MNYYEVLEITITASHDEIRAAYRKCAKKYHPDLNRGKTSDKMIEVNQAYATLNDPSKRRLYDVTIKAGGGYSKYQEYGTKTKKQRTTPKGPFWDSTYRDEAADPFGFDGDMSRMWEDMMKNMRGDWTTADMGGTRQKAYSHNFTRKKLSVVMI
ncbi:MAG: J domain-containing protein, partial [Candidatus Levyibacteriota bacterium]